MDDAPRVIGDLWFVRHEDHRQSALAVQALEDAHDLSAGARVESTRRLVRQNDRRLVDQGAGDRDTLLLSTGQFRRLVVSSIGKPDCVERRQSARSAIAYTRVDHRQLNLLDRWGPGQKIELLEDEPDFATPHDWRADRP